MDKANPLQSAIAEIENLRRQIAAMERQIAALQQTVLILEPVYGQGQQVNIWDGLEALAGQDVGLTHLVREILLVERPRYVSPVDVRQTLLLTGFNAEGRSNFLAEIHNTLKRLKARGEAEEQTFNDGKKYRATGMGRGALQSLARMRRRNEP